MMHKIKLDKNQAICLRVICKLLHESKVESESYYVKAVKAIYNEIYVAISKKLNTGAGKFTLAITSAQANAYMFAYMSMDMRAMTEHNPYAAITVRAIADIINKQQNEPAKPSF
jgi:hypothetical protein